MDFTVKHFSKLTNEELYDILRLRVNVFVVEQECPYPEIDGNDSCAYHVFHRGENGALDAYLRVLPQGATFPTAALGRVISMKRRCGLGSELMRKGIEVAKEKFGADRLTIEAQTYARKFYEGVGFRKTSEEFLEDGIPHIEMQLEI